LFAAGVPDLPVTTTCAAVPRTERSAEILVATYRALDLELIDVRARGQFDFAVAVRSTLPNACRSPSR
jgi:hypothetical protein